ncbi:MAG: hypothetical protein K2L87_04810, partial [Clostridiales bacterium]|nr:hypothetical protein [Clostridiales bacterium]
MYRLKFLGKLLMLATIAVLVFACSMFAMGNTLAYAEEIGAEASDEETSEEGANGVENFVNGFLDQLKEKYGEDYLTYYNAILEEWGSVEAYLLSFADDSEHISDVAADGWKSFVSWLGEYSPIWGSALAVFGDIIVILFGKKALPKVTQFVEAAMDKFKTIFASTNKQYRVMK